MGSRPNTSSKAETAGNEFPHLFLSLLTHSFLPGLRAVASLQSRFRGALPTFSHAVSGVVALILIATFLALAPRSRASSVNIKWDACPQSLVSGYRILYGSDPANLSSSIDVGAATLGSVSGLQEGQSYYFSVCAYNSSGMESIPSAPVSYTVPLPPSLALNSSLDGTVVQTSSPLVISASVTANGHVLDRISFFVGNTLVGESFGAPYSVVWTPVSAGTYLISARLTFDGGSIVQSAAAQVLVNNPPPVIAMSPLATTGYVAPATVSLGAEVTANGHTISKVQFYNGSTLVGEDSSAPYSVSWSSVAAGTYTVKARLVYDNGTTMDSAAATITVQETVPVVVLTSPTAGASYTAPGQFTVTAAVTSNGQTISKVQFFANGLLIGERSSAPYTMNWSGVVAGTWSLEARASYGSSKMVSSALVNVTVGSVSAPWSTKDIGSTGLAGGAGVDAGRLFVNGAGMINNNADAFRFLYQPMSGDGQMTIRIDSMKDTGGGGSIGVMIRESLSVGSRHAFIGVSGSGSFRWEKRSQTGGNTSVNNFSKPTLPNAWLRLVRVGNTLSGYTSTDGVNWTLANNASVNMSSNVYVGLAVASGSTTALNTVAFSEPVVVP